MAQVVSHLFSASTCNKTAQVALRLFRRSLGWAAFSDACMGCSAETASPNGKEQTPLERAWRDMSGVWPGHEGNTVVGMLEGGGWRGWTEGRGGLDFIED
jgi:hypothetical protein